jgi:hypothetical protein
MASDGTAAANTPKPAPIEASSACTYESAGWSCGATGYLWFSEARTGEEIRYACPRCNSGLFVEIAEARARADGTQTKCICCGPTMRSLALECALEEAEVQRQFVCVPG